MSVVEMKVPVIGESINEVTLSQWLKADGSFVKIDEPICEFESDKATLEFPAEATGKLIHVAKEGDDLQIGALVAKIDTSVTADAPDKKLTADEPEGADKKLTADEPEGADKKLVTDKTDVPEKKLTADEPDAPDKKVKPSAKNIPEEKPENSIEKPEEISAYPSPAAAKILREGDVESSKVSGTGKEGRITKDDAVKAVTNKTQEPKEPASKSEPASLNKEIPKQQIPFNREERREKMSRMRRTISRRLVSAKNNTAMLTTFNEVDMSGIFEMRKKYQDQFVAKYGIKLGFMSIFAKACAQALLEKPEVNAFIDGDDLIYHDYVDISIAISTPNGLVVPPIHNVESLRFDEIEWKIKDLADKARQNKLTLEEMSGGTFTITNGGIFGSLLSTPILNEPQSAILGMHNIIERPVVVAGQIVIRPMMYVALSYDHRVIDGSTSVTFLIRVKELLEDPARLILGI